MVLFMCLVCNSNDMNISDDEEYVICNNCGDKQSMDDLEIGFSDIIDEDYIEGFQGMSNVEATNIKVICPKCKMEANEYSSKNNVCNNCGQKILLS